MKHYLVLFSLLCFAACNKQQPVEEAVETEKAHLGNIELQVSGQAEALPLFEEGLLLLHSFEYDDARTAFQQAQKIDSTFAMAYWGEAMTYNQPLWRRQLLEEGREVLQRLAETPEEREAQAPTQLEKDFLAAVEILFGEGIKQDKDQAYSSHLETMYGQYPNNQEVAAFYALSLLGAVPVGRDIEAYEKGAKIAQGVIDENPNHPGALHYLIHSYDDPGHAPMAVTAANSYSKVAPDAAHALHMPSHIYVSMGMWDEVVSSNIASWEASVKRMEAKELDDNARSYHALHWLMYGLLQQGKKEEASKIMDDFITYTANEPNYPARGYIITMKGTYLVESQDWDNEKVTALTTDMSDLNVQTRARYQFLEGWQAFRNKDQDLLTQSIETIDTDIRKSAVLVTAQGAPMCSGAGSNRGQPNQVDLDISRILMFELQAMKAQLAGDLEKAEEYLIQATELETNTSFSYGPPRIVMPSYELYGNWLLEQDRKEEALVQFEKALAKGPDRIMALTGKAKATDKSSES